MSNLGFNTGYVEELYRRYQEDPASVGESWRDFFADYIPSSLTPSPADHAASSPVTPATTRPISAPVDSTVSAASAPAPPPEPPVHSKSDEKPIRGPAAKIAENMVASLGVPTATSVRTVPVKLMAENRRLINQHQKHSGGEKVSFTHMIAFAVTRALHTVPNMFTAYREEDGKGVHVIPEVVNLGLAIDIERRGRRTLLVPNIKAADTFNFAQLLASYNDVVRRARSGALDLPDFAGTNATLTNPGMIGTDLSIPRLMPGQGVIVGVGAIGYPKGYYAVPPDMMSKAGISQVMTITSTYDHRVIQGAESGAFLAHIEQLLQGQHGFYDEIFSSLSIPYRPFAVASDTTPQVGRGDEGSELDMIRKQADVLQLIRAFRVRGHLQADVNPLGYEWHYHPELDPHTYGLTIWDLDRTFVTGGLGGEDMLPLRKILDILRYTYTRRIGIEFMHISDPEERAWLIQRIEAVDHERKLTDDEKRRMLEKLNAAEAFETFLHTKYIGHKRFSLEGSETLIPVLDRILSDAAESGVHEIAIGMAHRGRLNVLANILNKPYEVIFSEFEGSLDPNTTQGSGDVKYHLGASGEHIAPHGEMLKLVMASNPSHLEAVNPVVEGMVRAKQEALRLQGADAPGGDYLDTVIPVLIHGDAAFAGQGVVTETLHLSQLPGYRTGGTIHIVINNQIGFTTGPSQARSSTYATDGARMIQAPILHVNGDDPEACIRVARMALDYRQDFNRDIVIDMLCYRVRGHNEGDEPTFTQPLLYRKIEAKRSVRKLYTELLLRRGEMTPETAEKMLDDYRARLLDAFDQTKELAEKETPDPGSIIGLNRPEASVPIVETAASRESLDAVVASLSRFPKHFHVHPKLIRQFERRDKRYVQDGTVDWGLAELLAYGSLLVEGVRVRMSGQDSRRGTFSHRHAVVYDQETEEEYTPLNHIQEAQDQLMIYDSLLSEYAVCGFEYGYSVAEPSALVLWEAQFGDFANGAQILFDQFLSSAEEKWGQTSSLVLLLPHGYEGQGPEHSSARLERFLQMCAEGNLIVCTFTSPANFFHALRRQATPDVTAPLVVMSPKSLLRHPKMISSIDDFTSGEFRTVIPSENAAPANAAIKSSRLIFCSGKVYFDLEQRMETVHSDFLVPSVCRIEQFYPFPEQDLLEELQRHQGVDDVVWVQEEPENMGAWLYLKHRMAPLLDSLGMPALRYVGRAPSASPATGSIRVHQAEQEALLSSALG